MAAQQAGEEPVSAAKIAQAPRLEIDQAAGQTVEPAVERFIEILAGRRGADRRAHHHEHRDRHQRELVEPGPEGLGDDVHAVEALEHQEEDDRDRAEAERDRNTRQQHQQRDDQNEQAFELVTGLQGLRSRNSSDLLAEMPKGGARPVTRHISSARYCRTTSRVRSASRDRESTAAHARPCWNASLRTTPGTSRSCTARTARCRSKARPAS